MNYRFFTGYAIVILWLPLLSGTLSPWVKEAEVNNY